MDVLGVLGASALVGMLVAYAVLVVGAVISIIRSPQTGGMKLVWLVFVVVAPFLGSALWFLIGRNAATAALG
jgi:hypothetical protein